MSKLPVFDLIGNVISSTLENASYAMAISWPWLLVLFPLRVAVEIHKLIFGFTPIASYNGTQYDWPSLVLAAISFFAFSSIAVNWHRFILSGESAMGWQRLRMDSSVWSYFGFAIGVTLLAYVLILVAALALGFLGYELHGFGIFLAVIGGFAAFFAVIGWTARWSIKLVAIAVGRNSFSMGDFLAMTAGNHWRIIGLYLVFGLLVLLLGSASLAIAFVVAKIGLPVLTLAFAGVELLITWLQTIMGITMLTGLYAFFVEKRSLA